MCDIRWTNFRDICARLFDMVVRKSDIIFSTDMYLENSIKSMERKRRGCSEKLILPCQWRKQKATHGTGVREYARSSFKSILRSSHCERTRSWNAMLLCWRYSIILFWDDLIVVFFANSDNVFIFNRLIGSKNSCFSKRSEETFMKHSKSHGGAGGGSAGLSGLLSI
jgi:hypothetical protein